MKIKPFYALFFLLLLSNASAHAVTADVTIVNTVTNAISISAKTILPQALIWLGSFIAIQFVITNIGLLKSGSDIEAVWGKLLGSVLWFGFCVYVLNYGPDFIDSVGNGVLNKFAPNLPGPGTIITATLALCTSIMIGIAATGTSIAGIGNSSIAMVLVYILFIIFAIGMFMAIKIFMLTLELGLIIMLSPLSFSFLGLNALKDQGIAPFKALISLIYRIILLGIVCSAFSEVIGVAGANLDKFSWKNPFDWADKLNIILSMLCAFPILAYLAYKSDSIAASLASGGTNMGTGDVASAAAMGAAAGAALATGGAAAAGAATKGGQSMGDFMKSLTGGNSGSVSNASGSGSGGQTPVGTAPVKPVEAPALSVAENNAMRMAAGPELTGGSPAAKMTPNQSMAAQSAAGQAPSNAQAITDSLNSMPGSSSGSDSPTLAPSGGASSSPPSPGSADFVGPMKPADINPAAVPALAPSGSGTSAGIGGSSGTMDQKMDKLIDSLSKPAQKPSFGDRSAALNDHVAKEQAATHVSINTHQSD